MLGSDTSMEFVQNAEGLIVTPSGPVQQITGIADQQLAATGRVLRITHDKGWINDDEPGVSAPGWTRRCNLGRGDFNNDLSISETPGDVWSCSFTGSSLSVIAPRERGAGRIEVRIDGQPRETVELSTNSTRLPQQTVCEITGLPLGKHTIDLVNRGPGPVAVDAIAVH